MTSSSVPEALLDILARPGGDGSLVPVEGALVSPGEDSTRFPVVDGIPVFIDPEQLDEDKSVLRRFYEDFGWQRNDSGTYKTRAAFGFGSTTLQNHRRAINVAQREHFPENGTYFLDCASGGVAVDEYLEYSSGFNFHVCADLTLSALQGARERLGDRGLYVNADATRMPFKSESIDAALCSHTLYHVPEAQQARVLEEFHRVLKPGGVCVVFYNVGAHSAVGRIIRPYLNRRDQKNKRYDDSPPIYSHHYPASWFDGFRALYSSVELHGYQFFPNQVFKYLFPDSAITNFLGSRFSRVARRLEESERFIPLGQYVTVVLRK